MMENAARILVVEDDSAINDIVTTQLGRAGYEVEPAFSGTEAKRLLDAEDFDLVITDLMLPGMTGEEVVGQIRAHDELTPILVLSAKTAAADKVELLSLGADDYLTKPFDLDELTARVMALLRRVGRMPEADPSANDGAVAVGAWVLDPVQRTLLVDGEPIPLTRTEFDMLHLLARHPKRVFTKQEIYRYVWDDDAPAGDGSVATHISNLRTKLKASGTDEYVQTVWGIGFKLEVPSQS